jgi:ADP-ribose pyrophosphatase YjhB (NUDIX family)
MEERRVRCVALAAVRRPADGALLLGIGTDPEKGEQFCRPLGGGVEFGERSEEAVRREFREEIGAEVGALRPLGALENVFTYDGAPGHEVVLAYEASFVDPALYDRPWFPVAKESFPRVARWFRPEHLGPHRVPLYPPGLRERLAPGVPAGPPLRVIAVDWSGAAEGAERSIRLAEASGGRLLRLEDGRTREAVADHLLEEARRGAALLVGFDFAFSTPSWILEKRFLGSGPELWELAAREGEDWLRAPREPFWGRPGARRPQGIPEEFRATEREVPPVRGIRPKSVFQVGGAGAVGTGSIRGMPVLRRLRAGGFSVWPFDPLRLPAAIEIYPRVLTGEVTKSRRGDRERRFEARWPAVDPALRRVAAGSADAFDAAFSALAMDARRAELLSLPPASSRRELLEGRIWIPLR